MTIKEWDIRFWEFVMGRGEYPEFDRVTVSFPINYRPIPVTYIPSEEKVDVHVD